MSEVADEPTNGEANGGGEASTEGDVTPVRIIRRANGRYELQSTLPPAVTLNVLLQLIESLRIEVIAQHVMQKRVQIPQAGGLIGPGGQRIKIR